MAEPHAPDNESPTAAVWTPQQRKTWWAALAMAFGLLIGLDWLLARLLWLPFYFGLFFFLVAGLIVGGISFRVARGARTLSKGRILSGIIVVSCLSSLVTTYWEYRFIAATAGEPPKFAAARNAAMRQGRSSKDIRRQAAAAFRRQLAERFPPGGVVGYVRWAQATGKMEIKVQGFTETVSIQQHGLVWPMRTLAALLLMAAGLWLSYEPLRSSRPISNVLAPGEAYEEID